MNNLTASDLAAKADLVQLFNGGVWIITPSGSCRKLHFFPEAAGRTASLEEFLPLVTAWRENGRGGSTFGRWHNLADEEVAA